MSLPIPLAVRLSTSRTDRHVTADLRDLRFREVAQGGYASCTVDLDRPLSVDPDEIAHFGKLYVYDSRSGDVVWEGRVEDLGRSAGDGQVWQIAALGPSAHAQDRTVPYVPVDRRLEAWLTHSSTARYVQVGQRSGDGTPAAEMKVEQGAAWAAGDAGIAAYRAIADAGMILARVSAGWDTGFTSASAEVRLATALDNGTYTVQTSATANTAGGTLAASRGGTPAITAGHNWVTLRLIATAALTGSETTWGEFTNIAVRALLKDKTGTDITTGYTLDTVLASEVVADLLGRLLPGYDGANATIATTSYAIDQLAYPDGVTAAKMLEDLLAFHPDHRWGAFESNSAGKHRFEFVQWPTSVRYEASIVDGFDGPSSAGELYNAVTVRYRSADGQIKTVRRTSTVPVLDAAGLTREPPPLDLGDEIGSSANATRAGDQFLAQHQYPPNAGRLTIARKILDLSRGRMVDPWEIKAGELIRVRGVAPRPDALNASARDGQTVFRIQSKEYDAGSASATLELDSYARSTARALAQSRQPLRRRR